MIKVILGFLICLFLFIPSHERIKNKKSIEDKCRENLNFASYLILLRNNKVSKDEVLYDHLEILDGPNIREDTLMNLHNLYTVGLIYGSNEDDKNYYLIPSQAYYTCINIHKNIKW